MSGFQIFVTSLFVAFIVVGVGVFALFGGAFGGSGTGKVVVWGTMDEGDFNYLLDSLRSTDGSLSDTTYVKKDPATYEGDLISAMAAGTGPDLFLVSQDQMGTFGDKVAIVPYSTLSQATYLSSYIDEGRLFLTSQGALALPLAVDPLVMYWNRDILASAGLASPPTYWSDLIAEVPSLTALNGQSNITRSAIALGAWSNIAHAKEILSALFIQAGDPITARASGDQLASVFGATPAGAAESPAVSALRFYTEFSNPSKTSYTWNRSLPDSADAFAAGHLGLYLGLASEYQDILARNPNLRVGVAPLPQLKGASSPATFGEMTAVAASRTAPNLKGALAVEQKLTSATASQILVSRTGLPSARRDVVPDTSASAAGSVFVQSALIARGWIDPDQTQTDSLFEGMINSTISGASDPTQAVSGAAQALSLLLPYHPSQ